MIIIIENFELNLNVFFFLMNFDFPVNIKAILLKSGMNLL